jgi:glutamyl-tRNA reductase
LTIVICLSRSITNFAPIPHQNEECTQIQMWNEFKVVSLSHRQATVDVREQFHLSGSATAQFASEVASVLGLGEILVVSTCNRTEVYYQSPQDHSEAIIKMLCISKGISFHDGLLPFFQCITANEEAVRQLFEVAIGLQAQVMGDLQISGQVKTAYATSADLKLAGPFLHRLLHTIFHASKRVQQETAFRDGAASVSYVAAELAAAAAEGFASPRALIIGAGEMGRDAARNLDRNIFSAVTVMNRTVEKAETLAAEIKAVAQPMSALSEIINATEVAIIAVDAGEFLIQPEMISATHDQFRPLFLIDLSVPRAVNPAVENIPGVVVYDMDDIRVKANEALEKRMAAIPQVEKIVADEMQGFLLWSRELEISPVIQQLHDALEQIRKDEMARFLRHADAQQTELVDKVTKAMIEKIVKLPVLQLKAACRRGEAEELIGVLQDLFDLEKAGQKNPH